MAENGGGTLRRSSSQLSDASTESKNAKGLRKRRPKSHSSSSGTSSHKHDPSLTSFPSLSPEQIEHQKDALREQEIAQPSRTISQKVRDRKATLAGLTSASPSIHGRSSLFDDSPRSSLDVPGALHLGSDAHIERLIARAGAVKLIRQFAQDLAQRDAEISALRVRADERERELKKMLREVEVASADIEKRLHMLENPQIDSVEAHDSRRAVSRKATSTIDDMMCQAMSEQVGLDEEDMENVEDDDLSATIKPTKAKHERSTNLVGESRSRSGSVKGRQGWVGNSNASSRRTSRSSSILAGDVEDTNAATKLRRSSARTGLENLFHPPAPSNSYFIGGNNKGLKRLPRAGDDASVHSKQSSRSITSWTRIFGGNTQASREENGRPRSSSLAKDDAASQKTSANAAEAAMAALSKVNTHSGAPSASKLTTSIASDGTIKAMSTVGRTPTTSNLSANPDHARSNSMSLGPVEMDAILPMESKPPTMKHTDSNYQNAGLLTDRFGFIYDQRPRQRQIQATSLDKRKRISGLEPFGTLGHDSDSEEDGNGRRSPVVRPATSASVEEEPVLKTWQDYLKVSRLTRPTELLSHQPSAGAIISVNNPHTDATNTPSHTRAASMSVNSQKALPSISEPSHTTVTARTSDSASHQDQTTIFNSSNTDQEAVKLLLDQLNEIHDTLQAEKTVKWNEFLRKVRAERSSNSSTDRLTPNAPEADLLNGELIGIATLGRPSKTNRNKYLQFKALVLAGIPVSLRPKIWAECSGATSLRVPGYYDDLISRSEAGEGIDKEIFDQIRADIGRTLTDNVFFRHGPGVPRLQEILLAYSLHNPRVGYCQGMNTITGSMLLVLPDSESVFWLLVAVIDSILPSGYFDKGLLVSRADQLVLREYVREALPMLDSHLTRLEVELEAVTFTWFLSLYTGALSGEALYRVWDVVLCLNSSDVPQMADGSISSLTGIKLDTGSSHRRANSIASATPDTSVPTTPVTASNPVEDSPTPAEHDGTSSPFLFQLSLALLKLNEPALLALDTAASVYLYVNHDMTSHTISLDALIGASEALRKSGVVKREDVLARRKRAVQELGGWR